VQLINELYIQSIEHLKTKNKWLMK
jgi:hypothetical protein